MAATLDFTTGAGAAPATVGASAMMLADDRRQDLTPAPIAPGDVLDGQPVAQSVLLTHSGYAGVSSGLWECTAGRFHVNFGSDEIVHILEGEVHVTDDEGEAMTLRPGDIAHFPYGTCTVWHVPEHVRKFWVCTSPPRDLLSRVKRKLRRLLSR
jgi:uncharacterized cupin superfamily protein